MLFSGGKNGCCNRAADCFEDWLWRSELCCIWQLPVETCSGRETGGSVGGVAVFLLLCADLLQPCLFHVPDVAGWGDHAAPGFIGGGETVGWKKGVPLYVGSGSGIYQQLLYRLYGRDFYRILFFIPFIVWGNRENSQANADVCTAFRYLYRFGNRVVGAAAFVCVQRFDTGKVVHRKRLSFETNFQLSDFFGKFRNGVYDSITDSGLPAVYCGITALVLAVVFFYLMGVTLREKIGAVFMLVILALSFYYKGFNLVWHGFRSPVWFPYRYAFLFSFMIIYMAFRTACDLGTSGTWESLRKNRRAAVRVYAFVTMVFLVNLADLTTNGQAMLTGLDGQFGYAKSEEYDAFISRTKPLADWIKQQDDGLYRVNTTYEYSKNDAMLLGFHGMTHYSSTYNTAVNRLTKSLGIAQSHIWNSGYGSNPLLDSLFAVSYRISDRQEPECNEKIMDEGKGAAVYRNPLALPMVYSASVSDMQPELTGQGNPYQNQNVYLNSITGKNERYFDEVQYCLTEQDNGWLYTLTVPDNNPLYLYLDVSGSGWANVYVNGVWFGNYFSTETTCSLYIGSYAPGQQITVQVEHSWGDVAVKGAVIARLDMDVLEAALKELQAGGIELISHGGGKLKGMISVEEGQTIMTSIPYDTGWTVRVDGRKTEAEKFAGTFLAVEVPAGEHEISFSYLSPGFGAGMCLFVLAVLMAALYFWRNEILARGFWKKK